MIISISKASELLGEIDYVFWTVSVISVSVINKLLYILIVKLTQQPVRPFIKIELAVLQEQFFALIGLIPATILKVFNRGQYWQVVYVIGIKRHLVSKVLSHETVVVLYDWFLTELQELFLLKKVHGIEHLLCIRIRKKCLDSELPFRFKEEVCQQHYMRIVPNESELAP